MGKRGTNKMPWLESQSGAREMKRLFIAVPFSDRVQKSMHDLASRLQDRIGGRVVRQGNYHLTLRFLGICDAGQEEAARRSLSAIGSLEPLALSFGPVGRFVQGSQALIWLGVDAGPGLMELYNRLESALAREGLPTARRLFRPHVTLLRDVPRQASERLPTISMEMPAMNVERIALFESVFGPNGLAYCPLAATETLLSGINSGKQG